MPIRQVGDFLQADFFDNTGGLNISDSAFAIKDAQATGGFNYDYIETGGIRKRLGHKKMNSSADSQSRSLGIALKYTQAAAKTIMRATQAKIQAVDIDALTFTNLTQDTASASSTIFSSSSTQPVVFTNFNNSNADTLWFAGGGASQIYGAYSPTKFTANGTPLPTGSISTGVAAGSSTFLSTGIYRYAVVFRKASTQALSNAALDVTATVANTTDAVTITLSSISNIDTTKYDKIYIYRSAVAGVSGFTTGDLIAQVNSTVSSYVDTGSFISTAQNVPRAGSVVLDNSVLPTATYKALTLFKRRLVTATGNTVSFSDLNKPESWPTLNTITVPSGGDITGLAVISFVTPFTSTIDELLVVFKEREIWAITGNNSSDVALRFIDNIGCVNQSLIVNVAGFLAWIDYRGVFLWDGSGKPTYLSRPIEPLFQPDGDLDKSKLSIGFGKFYRKFNQIYWYLSHKTKGEQQFCIKLDLRLTFPQLKDGLGGRVLDGVFEFDSTAFPVYAGEPFIPPTDTDEVLLCGDASGFVYEFYKITNDAGSGIDFSYDTKFLDMGSPGLTKRYFKVIAWVTRVGGWNLTLDYWANYRSALSNRSTRAVPIGADTAETALWDIAQWDVASWDDYDPDVIALVFNLDGDANNAEGDCLKLRFSQSEADSPITILGFSVLFQEVGLRK